MSSLYAKLIQVIEKKITPMAGAVGQQKYVTSIRDGFITALPFMIVGSFMLVFIFPPSRPTRPGVSPGHGCNSRLIIVKPSCCPLTSAWEL